LLEKRIRKIIFVLFCIFGINAFAAKATVDVLAQAYVEHEQIFLKDIAKTENIAPELQAKLDAIVIGDTPKEGEVRSFSSYAISEIIRYNLRNDLPLIALKIPSEVRVSRKGTKLTPAEVKTRMVSWVQSTCEPCEVQISSLRVQEAGKLDSSNTWAISNTQIIPRGNFNISLDLFKDNNFSKKIFVQGNLRILKEVPVVKRSIQYGQRIEKEDISFEKQDITFSRETIPTAEEILGSEVAGNIPSNQIIWKSSLKRKMAVTRGNPVQVTIQNQEWRIHLTGISQDNGYVGDTVKILNPSTKKLIVGVIKDDGMVEVR
jgi:flagella basal body P-ring formation protein FlgA